MLKKTNRRIDSHIININIATLNERFDRVCIFNSNKNINDNKFVKYSGMIALGLIDGLDSNSTEGALNKFQEKINEKQNWFFGYLNYDLKNEIEKLNSENDDGLGFSQLNFFVPNVVFQITVSDVLICYDDEFVSEKEVDDIFNLCFNSKKESADKETKRIEIKSKITKEEYIRKVNGLKEHIQKGDIYEVNFCQEFYAEDVFINPEKVYEKLNSISQPPFAAFCKFGNHYLMSASPERFLMKDGDRLISQPIKGTIRRGVNGDEDELFKRELFLSDKERSENVMIVDLVRNDLSRLAKRASVKVEELFGIYSFGQVHQMISTVSCEVKAGISFTDIIKSTFPMGSMTGAPKVSAMKLIEEYESTKRGLYSGAVGYITPEGDFDFSVVIRSVMYNAENRYLSYMVGSAITAGCDAEKEYEECLLKAKAMFEAVNGRLIS
jgi:para-aminobenzoate synthetase component 1